MKIQFFFQHFWPDSPPYANMLRVLSGDLVKLGHNVSIITAQPSHKASDRSNKERHKEELDGIAVTRLGLLWGSKRSNLIVAVNKTLFPIRAFAHTLLKATVGQRSDIIVAATMPPVLNGLFGYAAARLTGAKFVYHMQDIYPEIASTSGIWKQSSFFYKILFTIDRKIATLADIAVVLSKDMENALTTRGGNVNIKIINNFALKAFNTNVAPDTSDLGSSDTIRFIFAGNVGRFQALEEIVSAFMQINFDNYDVEIHIVGDGKKKADLEKLAGNCDRIIFHGQLPYEQTISLIAKCDMAIVSLASEIYRYAYPSKTLTYMSIGIPIFALIEENSALAQELDINSIGIVSPDRSSQSIQRTFEKASMALNNNLYTNKEIMEYYNLHYSSDAHSQKWNSLIGEI